jgi:hypothetical protein
MALIKKVASISGYPLRTEYAIYNGIIHILVAPIKKHAP